MFLIEVVHRIIKIIFRQIKMIFFMEQLTNFMSLKYNLELYQFTNNNNFQKAYSIIDKKNHANFVLASYKLLNPPEELGKSHSLPA
jgi:hypothetical protein